MLIHFACHVHIYRADFADNKDVHLSYQFLVPLRRKRLIPHRILYVGYMDVARDKMVNFCRRHFEISFFLNRTLTKISHYWIPNGQIDYKFAFVQVMVWRRTEDEDSTSPVPWWTRFPDAYTVYPKKYAHGFVVLCFVVVMQSFIINSH